MTAIDDRLRWVDETEMMRRVTHVECLECGAVELAYIWDSYRRLERPTTMAEFDRMDPLDLIDCGCYTKTVPVPVIISAKPIIGTDADDDFRIPAGPYRAHDSWKYEVNQDLHDTLISGRIA